MEYRLLIEPIAIQEWENTIDYYNAKQSNLGFEVFEEIEHYLGLVEKNPLHYQKRYGEIRIAYTKRFHFGIFYIVNHCIINVLAILNAKEDASKIISF